MGIEAMLVKQLRLTYKGELPSLQEQQVMTVSICFVCLSVCLCQTCLSVCLSVRLSLL
jgi:hypothetical protein